MRSSTRLLAGLQTVVRGRVSVATQVKANGHRRPFSLAPKGAAVTPHGRLLAATITGNGRQIDLNFSDNTSFRLHTGWIVDSVASRFGHDGERVSEHGFCKSMFAHATSAKVDCDGSTLSLEWECGGAACQSETVPAVWLRAFAPSVARGLNPLAQELVQHRLELMKKHQGANHCFESAERFAKPWMPEDLDVRSYMYNYDELVNNEELQLKLFEDITDPGFVVVTGAPKTPSNNHGKVIEDLSATLVGRMTKHAVQTTHCWYQPRKQEKQIGVLDYDFGKPLDIHTDESHSIEQKFLTYMHQPVGESVALLADSMKIIQDMQRLHPEAYQVLIKYPVAHCLRHRWCADGAKEDATTSSRQEFEHELQNAPVIDIHPDGRFNRLMHSEAQPNDFELPHDEIDRYHDAHRLFNDLCEYHKYTLRINWPEGNLLIFNNFRLLHVRANIKSTDSLLVGGYQIKEQIAHRYRMLRVRQAQKVSGLEEKWMFGLPNTVVDSILGHRV